jgi:hypothetical protein
MGNQLHTAIEKAFEGSTNTAWTLEHERMFGSASELNPVTRERQVASFSGQSKVTNSDKLSKIQQAEFDYQSASAKEMFNTLAHIDEHSLGSWSENRTNFYLQTLKNFSRTRTPAFINMHQIKLTLAQFFNASNDHLQTRKDHNGIVYSRCDQYASIAKDVILEKEKEKKDRTLPEGKRNLMITLLQGLLGDIIEAQSPDQLDILQEIILKVNAISDLQKAEDKLAVGEVEVAELVEEMARQLINLLIIQTDSLSNFTRICKEDCQSFINFIAKLCCYLSKPAFNFDILARLLQLGIHLNFQIPEFYPAKGTSSIFLLDRPLFKSKLPKEISVGKVHQLKIFADPEYLYFSDRESKEIKVTARQPVKGELEFCKTVSVTSDQVTFFAGSVWVVNNKSFMAQKVDLTDSRGLGRTIQLKAPFIDPVVESTWPGSKPSSPSLLVYSGDGSSQVILLAFVKLTINGDHKHCLLLSKLEVSLDTSEVQIISTGLVNEKGKPLLLSGHSDEMYQQSAVLDGLLVLQRKDHEITTIDLHALELSVGSYTNAALNSHDGSSRKFHGVDVYQNRLLSVDKTDQLFERELTFTANLHDTVEADSSTGTTNISKLASAFGLETEEDDAVTEDTKKASQPEISQAAYGNISKVFTSLLRELSTYQSVHDLNFESAEHLKESISHILSQSAIDLRASAVENLAKLTDLVASMNDARLNLTLLTFINIYLEEITHFQDFESDGYKIISQKTLFHFRIAVEKMANSDNKKLSPKQLLQWDKLTVRTYLIILMLTRKAKKLEYGSILESMISSRYAHDYTDLHLMIQEVFSKVSDSKDLGENTSHIESTVAKVLQIGELIGEEEAAYLKNFGPWTPEKNLEISNNPRNRNVWALLVILLKNQKSLKEQLTDNIKAFSKKITSVFFDAFEAFTKVNQDCLANISKMAAFDSFIMDSFIGKVFYRYVTLLMYDESADHSVELTTMCSRYVAVCKTLRFAASPADAAADLIKPDFTFELDTKDSALVKYKRVSLPLFKDVEIEVSGMNPQYDTLLVFTTHVVDRERIVGCRPIQTVLVPHRFIHTKGRFKINSSELVLVLRTELTSKGQGDRKLSVNVFGNRDGGAKTNKIQAFNEICLQVIIDSCRQTFQAGLPSDSGSISEKLKKNLTTILDSKVFYNGIDFENFKAISLKENTTGQTLTEKCKELYLQLLKKAKIDEEAIEYFDSFCDSLHEATKKKNIHSGLLGDLGLLIVKSAFSMVLYQKVLSSHVNDKMLDAESLQDSWLKCNLLRVNCRNFDSELQFEELFNKIFLLANVHPLESDEEPPLSTRLNATKSMIEKIAPTLKALKFFFDEMKLKNMVSSKSVCGEVPELIVRFLSIKIETTDILKYLKSKKQEAEGISKVLSIIEVLMEESSSITEILTILNQVFRKDSNCIDYLTSDYSGLSHDVAKERVRTVQKIIARIMDYLCCRHSTEPLNKKDFIFALDSLKWLWRVQETYCVAAIDIQAILANNWQLFEDPEMQASLIELSGSILIFCSGQFDESGLKKNSQRDIELSNGVSHLIHSNLEYLNSVFADSLKYLGGLTPLHFEKIYQNWAARNSNLKRNRLVDRIIEETRDLDDNSQSKTEGSAIKVEHLEHLIGVDAKLDEPSDGKLTSAGGRSAPRMERQQTNHSGIGWLFEDQGDGAAEEELKVVASQTDDLTKNIKALQGDTEKLAQVIDNLLSGLSHVYNLVFSLKHHSHAYIADPLVDFLKGVIVSPYPEPIVATAMRLLSLISSIKEDLENFDVAPIFAGVVAYYKNIFDPSMTLQHATHSVSFLRSLLYLDQVRSQLKRMLASTDDAELLAALCILDLSWSPIGVGSMVYEIADSTKEVYLVLKKDPGLLATAIIRDQLSYRDDLKISISDTLEHNNLNHKVLTMCLRTRNFRFFSRHEIAMAATSQDQAACADFLSEVDLCDLPKRLGNSTAGLYAKMRWTNICLLSGNSRLLAAAKSEAEQLPSVSSTYKNLRHEDLRPIVEKFFDGQAQNHKSKLLPLAHVQAPASAQPKHTAMKAKINGALRKQLQSTARQPSETDCKVELNLFSYGQKEPQINHYTAVDPKVAKNLSEKAVSAMITTLIRDAVADRHLSSQATSEKAIVDRLRESLGKPLISKQIHNDLTALKVSLSSSTSLAQIRSKLLVLLFELGHSLVTDQNTWNNLYATKAFILAVEIMTEEAYKCTEALSVDGCEAKIDAILARIDNNSYMKSTSYLRHRYYESLQNILFLFARHSLRLFKPDGKKLKSQENFRWLSLMNEHLAAVCRKDEDQDDTIIKGILIHKLQETDKKFEDNPWRLELLPTEPVARLNTGRYTDWMFVSNQDSNFSFSLKRNDEKRSLIQYYINKDRGRNELNIDIEFSTEADSTVWVDTGHSQKDYAATRDLPHVSMVLGESLGDKGLVYGANNYFVANGVAYMRYSSYHLLYPIFSGVTLAGRDNYYMVMYRRDQKELVFTSDNSTRFSENHGPVKLTPYDLYPLYQLSLASFPVIDSILLVLDYFGIVMRAADGSIIAYFKDVDDNRNSVRDKMFSVLELLQVHYYGDTKRCSKDHMAGFSVIQPRADVPEVQSLHMSSAALVGMVVHTKTGSDLHVWESSKRSLTAIRFAKDKIKKVIAYDDVFSILLESKDLVMTDTLDLKYDGSLEDSIRYREVLQMKPLGVGKVSDIYFIYRNAVIGVVTKTVEDKEKLSILKLHGSDKDIEPYWDNLLTENSYFVENPTRDSTEFILANTRPVQDAHFLNFDTLNRNNKKNCDYPVVLSISEDNLVVKPFTNSEEIKENEISVILTRPLQVDFDWSDELKSYLASDPAQNQEAPFDAQIKTTAGCVYWSPTQGLVALEHMPEKIEDLGDYAILIKPNTKFRSKIDAMSKTFSSKSSILKSFGSSHSHALNFFPNFNKMTKEQFAVFKEEVRPLWEADFEKAKKSYFLYKPLAIDISMKSIENQYTSRSMPYKFLLDREELKNRKEWGIFEGQKKADFVENDFHLAMSSVRVLNSYYNEFYMRLPVFEQRCLDLAFSRQCEANVLGNFFVSMFKPFDCSNTKTVEINKYKALRYVTLTKQNYSILNQLAHGLHNVLEESIFARPNVERISFKLLGEGSINIIKDRLMLEVLEENSWNS